MFRRSKMKNVKSHAANASEIARQLAQDKRFRKQVVSAASHGSAAARRTRRGLGLVGALTRLASDEKLAKEVKNARADLQKAYGRLETRKRGHKLRNLMLLTAAASVAGVPKLRAAVTSAVKKARQQEQVANLDDLTKEDLYERAQKADIPGRSEMTKDELVAALRRHS